VNLAGRPRLLREPASQTPASSLRRALLALVKAYEPALAPSGLVNTTDHDSRVVRTHGQPPMQGYNAQLALNHQQVVLAAEVTTESPDFGRLEPIVHATQRELRTVGLEDPNVVLADALPGAIRRDPSAAILRARHAS
jgi:hypothetical protein